MSDLKVGDRVQHKDYGPGVITGVGQEGLEAGMLLVKLDNLRHRWDPLTSVEMLVPAVDVSAMDEAAKK